MRYQYLIMDVFSKTPFGGNQLAVLPAAKGLTTEGMQAIAREFNFAESTFVLPAATAGATCKVRIFTPKAELQFAGHPTIGTACALLYGKGESNQPTKQMIFEEGVGPVAVEVGDEGGVLQAMLTLKARPEQPAGAPVATDIATVLGLDPAKICDCFFAGVGLPFCFVHLSDRHAVDASRLDKSAWSDVLADAWSPHVFLFSGDIAAGAELYARMFAPALGIDEDPATGSACAALVGILAERDQNGASEYRLSVLQGVAMGRRSEIEAFARVTNGKTVSVSIGGASAFVAQGEIEIPDRYLSQG